MQMPDLKCDMYDMFSIGLGYNSTAVYVQAQLANWVARLQPIGHKTLTLV